MGMGFWTDLCCSQYTFSVSAKSCVLCSIAQFRSSQNIRKCADISSFNSFAASPLCVRRDYIIYLTTQFQTHNKSEQKHVRRIRHLENKRKFAWKDELRTMVAQECFTFVSCPQAQLHLLVYWVFFVVKHEPDGMQHLPKLLHDCGCPSKLYSTCHTQVERKKSQ